MNTSSRMASTMRAACAALLLLATPACTDDDATGTGKDDGANRAKAPARVVFISVDGLRPDAIPLAAPTLMELASKGSFTWDAQTIRPSVTLPSHTSMSTGTSPAEHGISWNDYRPGYVKETTPTVLALAHAAGYRSVLVSGKEKFATLAPPGSTDLFVWASGGDLDVAASAISELQSGFDVAMIHLPGTDDMGHSQGWMSQPYLAQVRAADQAVAMIIAKLPPDTFIIVTADHGGTGQNHVEDVPDNTTIPWIIVGPGVRKGYVLKYDVWTTDTAGTVAKLLKLKLPGAAIARPVDEAFEGFAGTIESCGSVANDGAVVMERVVPGTAPAAMGGTPAPGLYEMTSQTIHAGQLVPMPALTNRRFKGAVLITAQPDGALAMEQAEASVGNNNISTGMGMGGMGMGGMGMGGMGAAQVVPRDRRSRFRIAAKGTQLEKTRLCSRAVEPGTNPTQTYSVEGNELSFWSDLVIGRDLTVPVVTVYTRKGI